MCWLCAEQLHANLSRLTTALKDFIIRMLETRKPGLQEIQSAHNKAGAGS